ncbi:MAG: SUMF1/EgtB/PvdO family nonheme iron enzyme, partial [Gammaproteobacteria bacterium]
SWRNPGYSKSDNTPVTCISWDDSKAYLSWLSEQTQGEWRLPTEAEWEYAARAGSAAAYSWGDQSPVCDRVAENGAQFGNCEEKAPVTVGSYTANAFGLYDVHGNAWEWVEDCYVNNYDGAQTNGSARNDCGNPVLRVLRGGSWSYEPWYLRAAYRGDDDPAGRTNDVGFRAARTIHPLPFTDVTPTPQLPEKDAVATELVQTIPEIPVPKMVQIPAGTFLMGCDPKRDDVEGGCFDNEKPAHEVRLKSFWLSETEVTVEQYLACVQAGGCSPPEWQETKKSRYEQLGEALTGKNYPIVGVSWRDANDYTQWLSQQTGQQYRLPTEADWE